MATISLDDVWYVARLANIALSDEEARQLQGELDAILGYVRQLDALDTTGLEPTYQVTGLSNIMRQDELVDYHVSQQALLQNVPAIQDDHIKVPKIL